MRLGVTAELVRRCLLGKPADSTIIRAKVFGLHPKTEPAAK